MGGQAQRRAYSPIPFFLAKPLTLDAVRLHPDPV